MEIISDNLLGMVKEAGIKQTKLAGHFKIHVSHFHMMLKGDRPIPDHVRREVIRICKEAMLLLA